jgi:hypothetical protein
MRMNKNLQRTGLTILLLIVCSMHAAATYDFCHAGQDMQIGQTHGMNITFSEYYDNDTSMNTNPTLEVPVESYRIGNNTVFFAQIIVDVTENGLPSEGKEVSLTLTNLDLNGEITLNHRSGIFGKVLFTFYGLGGNYSYRAELVDYEIETETRQFTVNMTPLYEIFTDNIQWANISDGNTSYENAGGYFNDFYIDTEYNFNDSIILDDAPYVFRAEVDDVDLNGTPLLYLQWDQDQYKQITIIGEMQGNEMVFNTSGIPVGNYSLSIAYLSTSGFSLSRRLHVIAADETAIYKQKNYTFWVPFPYREDENYVVTVNIDHLVISEDPELVMDLHDIEPTGNETEYIFNYAIISDKNLNKTVSIEAVTEDGEVLYSYSGNMSIQANTTYPFNVTIPVYHENGSLIDFNVNFTIGSSKLLLDVDPTLDYMYDKRIWVGSSTGFAENLIEGLLGDVVGDVKKIKSLKDLNDYLSKTKSGVLIKCGAGILSDQILPDDAKKILGIIQSAASEDWTGFAGGSADALGYGNVSKTISIAKDIYTVYDLYKTKGAEGVGFDFIAPKLIGKIPVVGSALGCLYDWAKLLKPEELSFFKYTPACTSGVCTGGERNCAIAVDGEQNSHVVYIGGGNRLYYMKRDRYGNILTGEFMNTPLVDVSGFRCAKLSHPDIITDGGNNAHISADFHWQVVYPVPWGEFSFIMDYVAYRMVDSNGTVIESDVLQGWPGQSVIQDPLVLGLGYGYMFDTLVTCSKIGLDESDDPVVTSNVRVFYPSMWYIFSQQIKSIAYPGLFGGLVGGYAWIDFELGYTLTHITYWNTIRTATYTPGYGVSPDENWVWETVDAHIYSIDPDIDEDGFWSMGSDLKTFSGPSSLDGNYITYLEHHLGDTRLLSTHEGELSSYVNPWDAGLAYDSEGNVHLTWQSGEAIYYYGPAHEMVVLSSPAMANPYITVGPKDWIYIAFIDNESMLSYVKSEDGLDWTGPVTVSVEKVRSFDMDSGTEPGSVCMVYEGYSGQIYVQCLLDPVNTIILIDGPLDFYLEKDGEREGPGIIYLPDGVILIGDTDGFSFNINGSDSGSGSVSVAVAIPEACMNESIACPCMNTHYRNISLSNETAARFYLTDYTLYYVMEVDFDGDGIIDYSLDPNCAPYVEILSPTAGSNYTTVDNVTLSASACDSEDGALGGSAVGWYSSIDGFLGTGNPMYVSNLSYGDHSITAVVADSLGESSNDSTQVFVDDLVAPAVVVHSPQSHTFHTNVVFLNYSVDEPLSNSTAEFSNGQMEELSADTFIYNIALLDVVNGTYQLNLTVWDLAGNPTSTFSSFTLAIDNYAPVLDFIPPVEVFRGELVDLNASGYDLDNDSLNFTYGLPLDSEGRWQTTLNDTGAYYVNVSVSDGVLSDMQFVRIGVLDRPPVFDLLENVRTSYGIPLEFDLHAVDPEGAPVTYSMEGPVGASLVGSHFTWTPTLFQVRNHLVRFYASDGVVNGTTYIIIAVSDESIMCSFDSDCGNDTVDDYCVGSRLYVRGSFYSCRNAGTPESYCILDVVDEFFEDCLYDCVGGVCTSIPLVTEIDNFYVNESDSVVVYVDASDPENDTLSYSINDPRFMQNNNIFTWNTTYDDSGRYRFVVTVSDGFNNIIRQFNVFVRDFNRPPMLSLIPDLNLTQGVYFNYEINASDPDGDLLLYELVPPRFPVNLHTGKLSINPRDGDVGTHLLEVRVSDGEYTTSRNFTVTVNDVNDAPRIEFIPPQIAKVNESFNYQVNASDPDGDTLFYSDDSALFNISSSGLIQFTPSPGDVGIHMTEINVSDMVLTTSQWMPLIVTDEDGVSVLDRFPDFINVTEGDFINLWDYLGGGW